MNKIVIHPVDGEIVKGSTGDFRPNREKFHVMLENGDVSAVGVADLKAIFFVKDLGGDAQRMDRYRDSVPGGGRKVEVRFHDGEIIVGFTTVYSSERQGWFLVPGNDAGNNLRIFVVNAAVADVNFLD